MPVKKNTKVRFLGGFAPRKDLLGIISCPVGYDGADVEHTRFFMVTPERWVHQSLEADIVSVVYETASQERYWRLLSKRGKVYTISKSGLAEEQIHDAGTGPGKFGYLNKLKIIDGKIYSCGYCHQFYQRGSAGWSHHDSGILQPEDTMGASLNDFAGDSDGRICAVGNNGQIMMHYDSKWHELNSPTHEHLYAVCYDQKSFFYAAGANGCIVKGDGLKFEIVSQGKLKDSFWDIVCHQGSIVASASPGIFTLTQGALVPYDNPPAPQHTGYKLATAENRLWSIGTHQIFCLDDQQWKEWLCPDNL